MIKKSIKIAFQRLLIYKAYSAINISGLGIAMAVSISILLFTYYHFSFDSYIPNCENSFRIITRYGDGTYNTNTFTAFDDLFEAYPEVESHTLCFTNHNVEDVFVNDSKIKINNAIFIDDSFMDYFSVDVISGDRESIVSPNSIMVTPEMALKLFPDVDPLGQTVLLRSFTRNQDSLIPYTVTGIVKPLPNTSHLVYDILLSQFGHFEPTVKMLKTRKVFGGTMYLKLYPNADINDLEIRLKSSLESALEAAHGPPLDAFNHSLQPVRDIHFTPGLSNEMQPTIRRSSLNILLLVGFLIFVIAIMNFVIMHIARSTYYKKATLVIRFLGGNSIDLFLQTFVEVATSVGLGFMLAIILLISLKLALARYFFDNWIIPFETQEFWILSLLLFIAVVVIVSILSSISLFRNQTIIGDNIQPRGVKAAIPIVILQFVLVIALTGFAMLVNKQMSFIENKELGYSENVIVVKIPQINSKVKLFRDELLNEPGIISAATVNHYPGSKFQDMTFSEGDNSFPFKFGFADEYAMQALNIMPVKYFTDLKEMATDGWIINETFYNKLRTKYSDEQIGSGEFSGDENSSGNNDISDFVIIGVVKDFHYTSLHADIESFAYFIRGPKDRFNRYALVRFRQNQVADVLDAINSKMDEIYPSQPVTYSFLNEHLNAKYASEQLLLMLINAFSILAIFVACLGLMGLSIFITEKRSKEIGIRKVNGANVMEILILLNKDIIRWVIIAFVIAFPIAYFFAQRWLENFAFRTPISWWIFILAGLFAVSIALITVSWQTFRAARKNPVESLRYE